MKEEEYEKLGYLIQVSDGGFSVEYDNTVVARDNFEWNAAVDSEEFESDGKLLIIAEPDHPSCHIITIQLKEDANGKRCLVNGETCHSTEKLGGKVIDFESYTQKEE